MTRRLVFRAVWEVKWVGRQQEKGLYFRLSKATEDYPEPNKKRAVIAMRRFVSLNPHNIAQKTEVVRNLVDDILIHVIL